MTDYVRFDKTQVFIPEFTVTCKCGHRVRILGKNKKKLCRWCGTMNYLDKKQEFEERMRGLLK